MPTKAKALVQVGPKQLEFQELEIPEVLAPGSLIVRVEANGLCHSDLDAYDGTDPHFKPGDLERYPRIMGHEIVGVIERMGPPTSSRAGLQIGDRVAIDPYASCGECANCAKDDRSHCTGWGTRSSVYGHIPTTFGPGLWGGYATHVYVHPNTVLFPFPAHVSPLDATLWNPLGGAIQWAVMNTGMKPGASVAVLGSGQRGLACVVAVKDAGASSILATGLTRDQYKLDLAKEFGADLTVDVEQENLVERANAFTQGKGFDIVVDTTPYSFQAVQDGLDIVRAGGIFVTVGIKNRPMPDFPIDKVTLKNIRIQGSLGQSREAYSRAAKLVSEGTIPLSRMRTHVFGFDKLDEAIAVLRGERPDEKPINVIVTPTTGSEPAGDARVAAESLR